MSLGIGSNDFLLKLTGGMGAGIGGQNVVGGNNQEKSIFGAGENIGGNTGVGAVNGGVSGTNFGSNNPFGNVEGATSRYDKYDTYQQPAHASFVEGYDNQVAKFLDLNA